MGLAGPGGVGMPEAQTGEGEPLQEQRGSGMNMAWGSGDSEDTGLAGGLGGELRSLEF